MDENDHPMIAGDLAIEMMDDWHDDFERVESSQQLSAYEDDVQLLSVTFQNGVSFNVTITKAD